jgi:ribosomal protein S18 acetylase RimI-like enzyme
MSNNTRPLTNADIEPASSVLARAFYNDPLWLYLLPNPTERAALVRHTFRATFPAIVGTEQVYGIGDPLAGVAIWSTPQPAKPFVQGLFNPFTVTLAFSPLVLAFRRALPAFIKFEEMRKTYAPEPHYYLNSIGVVPEAQGRGYASKLIRPFLAKADSEGVSAYTETATPENVPLYEHYGFVVQEEYALPNTPLRLWSFLKTPRKPA